jgi:hypothetical protein
MLLASPEVPAAIILLAAGLLACFMGYRLFRWLLGLYGFVGGAYLTSLFVSMPEPWMTAAAVVTGGLIGALFLLVAYLAGVAILGAGLGALAVSLFWTPDGGSAETWVVIAACLVGAIAAVSLQRYVIIVGTSFGGAWTALVGALALGGHTESVAAAAGDFWQLYPMVPANGQVGFAIGWFGLGLLAALVQLRWSSPMRSRKRRSSEDDK